MSIAANSIFVRLIRNLIFWIARVWNASGVSALLDRVERGACAWAGGSGVCRVIARDGAGRNAWPDSLTCRVVAGVINIPCALVKWFYKVTRRLWDGSAVFRVLSPVGTITWVPLGLLIAVMLCCPHSKWDNLYGFIGVLLVTALFLLGAMTRSRQRLQVEQLGPYMTLYMAFICYGLLASFSLSLSMRFFVFHVTCFLIVLLLVSSIHKYSQLHCMLGIVGAGLLGASFYGCYQSYVGVEVVASLQDLTLNAGMPGRVYSFFDNPNNFAEILVMLVPLMLALLINAKSISGRFLTLIVLALSVVAIGATYGRSCWIGLSGAVVLFFAFYNWRLVPVLLVVGIMAIPFLPESIYNRILTIGNMKDSSTRYRFYIYEASENLLRDYGLRGVGLGNDVMREIFKQYPTMPDGNYPIHTHNNYLQLWVETGFFGMIAYLALMFGHLKSGVKAYVASTDKRIKTMLAASLSAMCGILVVSIAEYTWFYPRNMFLFWFLFGVIAVCIKLARTPEETK